MKRILSLIVTPFFLVACATPTFLPALGNVHSYQNCDMVYESHVPGDVMKYKIAYEALSDLSASVTNNPSVASTLLPSTSQWNAMGQNAAQLGVGAGTIVSSITNNATPYALIGAAVTGGITALGNIRSEDRSQDRIGVCMPHDAKLLIFVNGDANVAISKRDSDSTESVKDIIKEMRTGGNEPNREAKARQELKAEQLAQKAKYEVKSNA